MANNIDDLIKEKKIGMVKCKLPKDKISDFNALCIHSSSCVHSMQDALAKYVLSCIKKGKVILT